jgi:hypothetical protein
MTPRADSPGDVEVITVAHDFLRCAVRAAVLRTENRLLVRSRITV